jgi:hypothetical protein
LGSVRFGFWWVGLWVVEEFRGSGEEVKVNKGSTWIWGLWIEP